ncbi:putative zinc finger protein [Orchesella cincta]|uniref:Putative zinc finger protein n=1 Tax=Orchesella cincta TaxID=48709 RepID=A0A1D2MDF3_ORCCI|nr:putative zinc finger protein [Orchesella cincta]
MSKSIDLNEKFPTTMENDKRKQKLSIVLPDHITVYSEAENAIYHCNICGRSFKTKANFKYHISCKTGIKLINCDVCGKGFNSRGHYIYHLRVHAGFRPFRCELCNKDFLRTGDLKRHVTLTHGDIESYTFKCQLCPKTFSTNQGLKAHLICHSNERPFVCGQCNKRFKTRGSLQRHLNKRGERKFKCNECDKGFTTKNNLKTHMVVHCIDRPYACNQCQLTFKHKKDLARHGTIHKDERNYKCEMCGREFLRKDNFKRHQVICQRKVNVMMGETAAATVINYSKASEIKEISDMRKSHCEIGRSSHSTGIQLPNDLVGLTVQPAELVKVVAKRAVTNTGMSNAGESRQVMPQAPLTASMLSSYGDREDSPRCGCLVCSTHFSRLYSRLYEANSHLISSQRTRGYAIRFVPFPIPVLVPVVYESRRKN